MNLEIIYHVSLDDIVKFISTHYKLDFFSVNRKPEDSKEFKVTERVDTNEIDRAKDFIKVGYCTFDDLGDILNTMCSMSWINSGTYVIKV